MSRRIEAWVALAWFSVQVAACMTEPGSLGELPAETEVVPPQQEPPMPRRTQRIAEHDPTDVDILFVVDNGPSMVPWVVEGGVPALVDPLVAQFEDLRASGHWASYRVAVTTTDMGNPACTTTKPERGALIWQSCRERPADFIDERDGVTDAVYSGCYQYCPPDLGRLPEVDARTASWPWLQVEAGSNPVATGPWIRDTLRCMIPQGIAGCEFGSPLAATAEALRRMEDPGDIAHGFLRDYAHLVVIVVTNTVDCSHHELAASIFEPGGNRAFWSDPEDADPTMAICWNAGVACASTADGRLECAPQDYDASGVPTTAGSAVLVPVDAYVGLLGALQQRKQEHGADLWFLAVSGVPVDIHEDRDFLCEPAVDAETLYGYGIGPSCVRPGADSIRGYPPVRLHAVADALQPGRRTMRSICESPHGEVVHEVVAATTALPELDNCLAFCAADQAEGAMFEPDCVVEEARPGDKTLDPVMSCVYTCSGRPCSADQADAWQFPAGEDVCYRMATDSGGESRSSLDDMEGHCLERGSNLQVLIERRTIAEHGTEILANCRLSERPNRDCPRLSLASQSAAE